MATVQCPIEIPASHDHEVLESKRHVPYVRCDGMGSHIYFKTDAAREWLAAHLVNDGSRANPLPRNRGSDEEEAGAPPDEVPQRQPANQLSPLFRKLGLTGETEPVRCGNCGKILAAEQTPCPYCGVELEW